MAKKGNKQNDHSRQEPNPEGRNEGASKQATSAKPRDAGNTESSRQGSEPGHKEPARKEPGSKEATRQGKGRPTQETEALDLNEQEEPNREN